ncbi:MAG: hypothetical protein R6W70_10955 [bacterium]
MKNIFASEYSNITCMCVVSWKNVEKIQDSIYTDRCVYYPLIVIIMQFLLCSKFKED